MFVSVFIQYFQFLVGVIMFMVTRQTSHQKACLLVYNRQWWMQVYIFLKPILTFISKQFIYNYLWFLKRRKGNTAWLSFPGCCRFLLTLFMLLLRLTNSCLSPLFDSYIRLILLGPVVRTPFFFFRTYTFSLFYFYLLCVLRVKLPMSAL